MDCPETIPVDTHVFQIAKKFGFLKKGQSATLNEKTYIEISDAFVERYGDKAGWAHQILFAGDLASFKDKIASATPSKTKPKSVKTEVGKKRTISQITQSPEDDNSSSVKAKAGNNEKRRKLR